MLRRRRRRLLARDSRSISQQFPDALAREGEELRQATVQHSLSRSEVYRRGRAANKPQEPTRRGSVARRFRASFCGKVKIVEKIARKHNVHVHEDVYLASGRTD